MEIAIVLTLLVAAMVLFIRETLPVDITTLLVLLVLIGTGILTPDEAFQGFGSDIIIILASVFVISGAMRETNLIEYLGAALGKISKGGEKTVMASIMASVAFASAWMNNTTVTALMMGPTTAIARRRKISSSKLLMPLAFASILGGTCTLIGTSTNVAVSGYLSRVGLEPIGFFELTSLGLLILLMGIGSMLLFGRKLLPDHPEPKELTEDYGLQEYFSEILVRDDSPLVGQRLRDSDLGGLGFRVLKIVRKEGSFRAEGNSVLRAGDLLLVNGPVESLMKVRETKGISIRPDLKFNDTALQGGELEIMEVVVTPNSAFLGRSIQDIDLANRFQITVLAVNRHGTRFREKLKTVRLETGDMLLVQGPQESMGILRQSPGFAVYSERNPGLNQGRKGWMVLSFLILGVFISALGWAPLSMALLGAAVATVLCGAIPMHKIYDSVEWRLLVLIAGMTAFGVAMEKTEAANLLADGIVTVLEPFGVTVVLAGFVILTIVLTQPMSNAAAALVVLPIALSSAEQMGLDGRSFAIAITYAASVSLITPFEPSCLLVYGAGRYRFGDFLRVGGAITVLLILLIIFLVPLFFPLGATD